MYSVFVSLWFSPPLGLFRHLWAELLKLLRTQNNSELGQCLSKRGGERGMGEQGQDGKVSLSVCSLTEKICCPFAVVF